MQVKCGRSASRSGSPQLEAEPAKPMIMSSGGPLPSMYVSRWMSPALVIVMWEASFVTRPARYSNLTCASRWARANLCLAMALQFGVNLFPQQWEDVVRIEELGYDSAWTSEHIFFYFPTFDAL